MNTSKCFYVATRILKVGNKTGFRNLEKELTANCSKQFETALESVFIYMLIIQIVHLVENLHLFPSFNSCVFHGVQY